MSAVDRSTAAVVDLFNLEPGGDAVIGNALPPRRITRRACSKRVARHPRAYLDEVNQTTVRQKRFGRSGALRTTSSSASRSPCTQTRTSSPM
jgi:hypothetical protein